MSQVDNLLNSLSANEPETYTAEPETEGHIVVGSDRFITVPEELKRIAVQFDHDIETVTFDCPRYWDDHDMSQLKVYINYLLPDGTPGKYIAKNVAADGDLMHFDWTISRDVTQFKGNLSFLVCVTKTDKDGNESQHWNSELCRDLYISEGLECDETILSEHPDIITDLLTRMAFVEETAVQAEYMESLVQYIRELDHKLTNTSYYILDLQEALDKKMTTIGDSFANPIKKTVNGKIVAVNDVSPIDHTAHVKVKGKNLLDIDKGLNSFFVKNDDGTYTITRGNNRFSDFIPLSISANTTISISHVDMLPEGFRALTIMFDFTDGTNTYVNMTSEQTAYVRTYEKDIYRARVYLLPDSVVGDYKTFRGIQIEYGATATEYEPYIDPSTVTLNACGVNLVDVADIAVERSNAWSSEHLGDFKLPSGTYTARLKFLQEGDITHVAISARKYGVAEVAYANVSSNNASGEMSMRFTIPEGESGVTLYVYSNNTAVTLNTKCTFSDIRIEAGSTAGEYEPYKGITYTPSEYGTVDIQAVYPTMTLYTDADVNIEVEYNRDTNMVISEIDAKLNAFTSSASELAEINELIDESGVLT